MRRVKRVIEEKEDDYSGKCLSVGEVQTTQGGDFCWRETFPPPVSLEGRSVLEPWAARFGRRMLKGSPSDDFCVSSGKPKHMSECECWVGVCGETEVYRKWENVLESMLYRVEGVLSQAL